MEPQQQILNGFQWIGIALGGLFGAIGLGAIILAAINRYWKNQDARGDVHETNQSRVIDADIIFKQSFVDRLIRVEDKLEKAQDQLSSQLAMNARVVAQNKEQSETIAHQEMEIKRLQDNEILLDGQIKALTVTITRLEKEIAELKK